MWSMTLGEFLDVIDGARAAERDRNLMLAMVACSFGGGDPHRMIGETPPGNSSIDSAPGWRGSQTGDGRAAEMAWRRRQYEEIERRDREAAHRVWMPARLRSWLTEEEREERAVEERLARV